MFKFGFRRFSYSNNIVLPVLIIQDVSWLAFLVVLYSFPCGENDLFDSLYGSNSFNKPKIYRIMVWAILLHLWWQHCQAVFCNLYVQWSFWNDSAWSLILFYSWYLGSEISLFFFLDFKCTLAHMMLPQDPNIWSGQLICSKILATM